MGPRLLPPAASCCCQLAPALSRQACCPCARSQYNHTAAATDWGPQWWQERSTAALLHSMLAVSVMAPSPAASTDQHPATCHCSTEQQVAQLDSEQVRSAAQRVLSDSKRGSRRRVSDYQVQQVTLSAMHCFDLDTTQVDF